MLERETSQGNMPQFNHYKVIIDNIWYLTTRAGKSWTILANPSLISYIPKYKFDPPWVWHLNTNYIYAHNSYESIYTYTCSIYFHFTQYTIDTSLGGYRLNNDQITSLTLITLDYNKTQVFRWGYQCKITLTQCWTFTHIVQYFCTVTQISKALGSTSIKLETKLAYRCRPEGLCCACDSHFVFIAKIKWWDANEQHPGLTTWVLHPVPKPDIRV